MVVPIYVFKIRMHNICFNPYPFSFKEIRLCVAQVNLNITKFDECKNKNFQTLKDEKSSFNPNTDGLISSLPLLAYTYIQYITENQIKYNLYL